MSGASSKQNIKVRSSASTFKKARVDFDKSEFDALIENKGHNAYIDKAIQCPCRTKHSDSRIDCVNCLGSGWLFIDRTKTRVVAQDMGASSKYEAWSELNYGQIKVTARDVEKLSFMDRITIIDADATTSQVLEVFDRGGSKVVRFIYDPKEIKEIFMFDGAENKLKRLTSADYALVGNVLTLSSIYKQKLDIRMVARYVHSPQFHVIDMFRESMVTRIKNRSTDKDSDVLLPTGSIGRRSHYVFDEEEFLNFDIPDNSAPAILGGIEYELNFGLS